ncbi:MAG: hypothetical protein CK539_05095 [Flavobacteriales bacterium]|nr:MAG: hypothetical protein CK539_05095 [Flavobacteriales bacterium]
MNWTENQIRHIVAEFAEENAFACNALFKICEIRFTDQVRTLAVTIAHSPALLINKSFFDAHAIEENDIKCCLMHEFLHVLLQHTEKYKFNTPLLNLALDSIINSIIHRVYGSEFSSFFSRYYKDEGIQTLLSPPYDDDKNASDDFLAIRKDVYAGKFSGDNLYELLQYLFQKGVINSKETILFVGNHSPSEISPENRKILDEILKKMDGSLIWNKPGTRGSADGLKDEEKRIKEMKVNKWRNSTHSILKKCLTGDYKKKNKLSKKKIFIPVLSNTDRRAIATYSLNKIIPMSATIICLPQSSETVNIYFDVSGSMNPEIDLIISLLHSFRNEIKKPLWVFSDAVSEATFQNGSLIYHSSGGTSISCVFDHIKKMKFKKSLIVTDGYTEDIDAMLLAGINTKNIWVIVSAEGNPSQFEKNNIKYHQLTKI